MFGFNNLITAGKFFVVIAGELILIFIAVSFLIGVLMEYLPPSRVREFLSNKLSWAQYLLGSSLGALTPFCSCSTVPITAGLLKGGVPFGPTMAFLFASPVLNPIIIALVLSLLGYKVTAVYVVVTFIGSIAAALLISRLGMEAQVKPLVNVQAACCGGDTGPEVMPVKILSSSGCCSAENNQPLNIISLSTLDSTGGCCTGESKIPAPEPSQGRCCAVDFERDNESATTRGPFKEKMQHASSSAFETFKGVFWYLLLGAGIGAFIYGFFPQDFVIRLAGPGNPWSIPIAAIIGVPMYIRAETIIPISAALVGKGMGYGTVLALIIGGAGASIPELLILGSMFKKKLLLAFVLNVFLVAIAAGYLVDILVY